MLSARSAESKVRKERKEVVYKDVQSDPDLGHSLRDNRGSPVVSERFVSN